MQVSPGFKTAIQNHLMERAKSDPLFVQTLAKPNKKIDDCITYILNEVKKSGVQGWADEEIFGMAVHYYDEDDLKPGAAVNARVVVNNHVDAPAKSFAQKVADKVAAAQVAPAPIKKPVSKKPIIENQQSLF